MFREKEFEAGLSSCWLAGWRREENVNRCGLFTAVENSSKQPMFSSTFMQVKFAPNDHSGQPLKREICFVYKHELERLQLLLTDQGQGYSLTSSPPASLFPAEGARLIPHLAEGSTSWS